MISDVVLLGKGVGLRDDDDAQFYCDSSAVLHSENWRGAEIVHPEKGELIDASYRNALVVGPKENAHLVESFEELTIRLFFNFFEEIGPFSGLKLEGSQFVAYSKGGFFKPHRDSGLQFRNRCFTIVSYLTSCRGGKTNFPELGLSVEPKMGRWVSFYSEYLHAAEPVVDGEKLIFVTWAVPN